MRVAEVFKIGIGPSSSHTVGPMRAALHFAGAAAGDGSLARLQADLFGSLALTGIGHGTNRAVMLAFDRSYGGVLLDWRRSDSR